MNDITSFESPVRYNKGTVALVVGGASHTWEEFHTCVEQLEEKNTPWVMIATNVAGVDYPGHIDHWATYHQEKMDRWVEQRRQAKFKPALFYWTIHRHLQSPISQMPFHHVEPWGGSSGMIGAQVGMKCCDKVILCGVPMEVQKHYHNHYVNAGNKKTAWTEAAAHRHAWVTHQDRLRGKVRSMGGWTADLLGRPDNAWIAKP